MKYKVGDRVKIKSLDWYNENKDETDDIECSNNIWFYREMSKFCGKVMTISHIRADHYTMVEDLVGYWTDEMIEGLVEEDVDLIPKFGEFSDNEPLDIPTMTTDFIKEHGFPCPNGYIFKDENGNIINTTKIVLEKKKKEYPKTYEECLSVLEIKGYDIVTYVPSWTAYEKALYQKVIKLRELIICRDAYWKIAGDEMGLGKPWEPDYTEKTVKYCLRTNYCRIVQTRTSHDNHPFSFPTEEMRDAFYENFKELIEQCKELL